MPRLWDYNHNLNILIILVLIKVYNSEVAWKNNFFSLCSQAVFGLVVEWGELSSRNALVNFKGDAYFLESVRLSMLRSGKEPDADQGKCRERSLFSR